MDPFGALPSPPDLGAETAGCRQDVAGRRTYVLTVIREGDLVVIEIEANAFLHHMVRNIAGVLMMIGMGKQPPGWAREILDARDRTVGGMTAPPDGLYLVGVSYDEKFGIPGDTAGPGVSGLFKT
jgi:tRNA pseudouridine38-40 synthase